MVCLPCIIYPFFLWLWYEWIYPYVKPVITKLWNENKHKVLGPNAASKSDTPSTEASGNELKTGDANNSAAKCPLSLKKES